MSPKRTTRSTAATPTTRSEEVRQRRSQQNGKRLKNAREQAYRSMPPTTSRDLSVFGVERPAPRKQMGNRRYNAALGIPREGGFSLPRLQAGPRLGSFILVLVLAAALYFLAASPYFRVVEPQYTGLTRLSSAEINAQMGLSGDLVFLLQPAQIEQRLRLAFPEMASASVRVELPNLLVIDVQERQPILLWQQGAGYTWIDENGIAFRPHGEAPGLVPVLAFEAPAGSPPSGADPYSPPSYVSPDMVKTAVMLASSMPPGGALAYDQKNGFGWTDSRGWQVYFGSESEQIPLKLRIYQSMLDSLASRGISPAFISIVHADAPYYRLEK